MVFKDGMDICFWGGKGRIGDQWDQSSGFFWKIFFEKEVLFGINFNIVKEIILLNNCTSLLASVFF